MSLAIATPRSLARRASITVALFGVVESRSWALTNQGLGRTQESLDDNRRACCRPQLF